MILDLNCHPLLVVRIKKKDDTKKLQESLNLNNQLYRWKYFQNNDAYIKTLKENKEILEITHKEFVLDEELIEFYNKYIK